MAAGRRRPCSGHGLPSPRDRHVPRRATRDLSRDAWQFLHGPGVVFAIFFSLFVFFNCFTVNQWLQYKPVGKWRDYLYAETVYVTLSLVAKSLLASQVFAGTLAPTG